MIIGALALTIARAVTLLGDSFHDVLDSNFHDLRLFNGFVTGLLAIASLAVISWWRGRAALEEAELRAQAEASLRESLVRYEMIVENARDFICEMDANGCLIYASPSARNILGYEPEELTGKNAFGFLHPDDVQAAMAKYASRDPRATVRFRRRDGSFRWLDATARFIGAAGESMGVIIARDITADREGQEALEKLTRAVEQTADAVVIADRAGIIQYVNPAFEQISGYTGQEVTGGTPRILKSGAHAPSFYKRLWDTIGSGKVFTGRFVNRKKDGSLYTEEKVIAPIRDQSGEITHFVSTGRDVTQREEAEETINRLAYTDALTGLPNRVLLREHLDVAIKTARRGGRQLAVIFMDVDRFKAVNDTAGHSEGDNLLRTIAERLRRSVRARDTVARFGGDEFVVLCPGPIDAAEAVAVSGRILASIRESLTLGGEQFHVSASAGIALFPDHGTDAEALLSHADAAMYCARRRAATGSGIHTGAGYAHSATPGDRTCDEGSAGARRVRGLLPATGQLANQRDNRRGSARALEPAGHGLVLPDEFIPVAEETGLIVPIGKWVLETACRQARAWHEAGLHGLRMAVNLSARQLTQPDLLATVEHALATSAIDPALLELEITESLAMDDVDLTSRVLGELKRINVHAAIDDFGTGYSSLNYLKHFPISRIKIDRSFVRDVTTDPNDAAIVVATIAMARGLGVEAIAEGIETVEQLEFLREHGCEEYQGYLLSKPMPPDEVLRILRAAKGTNGARPTRGPAAEPAAAP